MASISREFPETREEPNKRGGHISNRLRLLIVVPLCNGTDVGEAWWGFNLARELALQTDATIITMHEQGKPIALQESITARVFSLGYRVYPLLSRRMAAMLKPNYYSFYGYAKRIISKLVQRKQIDVVHQFTPFAMRYPCPAVGCGVPVVLGPIGGSVETPVGFRRELRTIAWYARLRRFDAARFRWDPWLRDTYSKVDVLLGVAPYVRRLLSTIRLRRFETMVETGIVDLPPERLHRPHCPDLLRLLYVGRVVRAKGVRDVIRAMAHLRDLPGITLDIVGEGEDCPNCEAEASRLGVRHRVRFHGRVSRDRVDSFYREADVFVFPSLREPSGTVIFEAMSFGLPMIVGDNGGPSEVVRDSVGLRVPITSPAEYPELIASKIRALHGDSLRLSKMGAAARKLVAEEHLFSSKAARLLGIYDSLL